MHVVVCSKMEIAISRLHSDSDITSSHRTARPKVSALIDCVWVKTNIDFDISSCDNSVKNPISHGAEDEFSSLQELSANIDLACPSWLDSQELTTGIDIVCNREIVTSWNIIIDIDSDEVPAGVASTAINRDNSVFSLTHIVSSLRIVHGKWNTSIDIVINELLTCFLIHDSCILATLEERESDLEVSMVPVVVLVDLRITFTLLCIQLNPLLRGTNEEPLHREQGALRVRRWLSQDNSVLHWLIHPNTHDNDNTGFGIPSPSVP